MVFLLLFPLSCFATLFANAMLYTPPSSPLLPMLLVHGAGSGAWCWFKVIPRLRSHGVNATALNLAGCGIDPGTPRSFQEYNKPLEDFMARIPEGRKIVLVGHSAGGLSVAHASEFYSSKIKVAVYIAAPMRPTDFEDIVNENEIMRNSSKSFVFDIDYSRKTFYQLCSAEDFQLASMLDRPFPSLKTAYNLTCKNYGSVPRVFIQTLQDKAFKPEMQASWVSRNPPKKFYKVNSDHSPFFSATDKLSELLVEIANTYSFLPETTGDQNEIEASTS